MFDSRHLVALGLSVTLSGGLLGCGETTAGYAGARSANGVTAMSADAQRAQFHEELMSQVDRNHDGALDRAETQDTWLAPEFDRVDADKNGALSRPELDRAFLSKPAGQAEGLGGAVAIGAGLVGVGLAGYLAYAGQVGANDLMYPEPADLKQDPSSYSIPYEKVSFASHDGLKLAGWYVPAAVKTDKAVLVLHGHGSNKDWVFKKYGHFLRQKYNVFLYDQRRAGESEGTFVSLGYFERKDAALALDQLRRRGNTQLGVMGESMGGAVAINLAAVTPDVKAVVSDCAFDSLQDAIAPRAAARKYPLSGLVAKSIITTASLRAKADLDDADPVKWVAKIAPRPFFLIHSMEDRDTVPMNGEKLYAAAQSPKQAWWPKEARHCTAYKVYPEEYKQRVLSFFEQSL